MKKQIFLKDEETKKTYNSPVLKKVGTLQELTRGLGLSGIDSQSQPKTGGAE